MTRQQLESIGLLFPIPKAASKIMPNDPPFDHTYPRPSRGKRMFHRFSGTQWWQECGRKRAHFELSDAITAAAQMSKQPGYKNEIYVCRWCDWFHVGHKWTGE